MRKLIYSHSIVGKTEVQKTGYIRTPTSIRIRVYKGGECSITTRGKIEPNQLKRLYELKYS